MLNRLWLFCLAIDGMSKDEKLTIFDSIKECDAFMELSINKLQAESKEEIMIDYMKAELKELEELF